MDRRRPAGTTPNPRKAHPLAGVFFFPQQHPVLRLHVNNAYLETQHAASLQGRDCIFPFTVIFLLF